MNFTTGKSMQEDALFIMMSSTKPVLDVAALMLIDEGAIRLDALVSKWIPKFEQMQATSQRYIDVSIDKLRNAVNSVGI